MTYAQYCKGLLYAKQYPDCDLIIGATDGDIPLTKDINLPGFKTLIEFMATYSGKKPIVLGKPGLGLQEYIIKEYNITNPSRYIFIGDNLSSDIEFGNALGFQTLFVLSGVHTYEDMMNAPDKSKPKYYANSIADFIEFFKDLE